MDYVLLDFKQEVQEALSGHYSSADRDNYMLQCSACDYVITQAVREDTEAELVEGVPTCPNCSVPVVIAGSRVWKELYGQVAAAKKRLSIILPTTEPGKELMAIAGLVGFQNESEHGRWKSAVRRLDDDARIERIIDWCVDRQRKKGYSTKGRALVTFALNSVEKAARDKPIKRRVKSAQKDTGRRRFVVK